MQKKLTTTAILTALILLGGLLLITPPLRAVHQVSWAPAELTQEVLAGESVTVPITVTAERSALPNTVVEVSPELAGFVTVKPLEPGTIPRGKSETLTVVIRPPITAEQGTLEGTISLHKKPHPGETLPPPLKVRLTIKWPSIVNDGVTISYPADWALDHRVLDLGETIRITNFGTAYLNGGIVPEGGAQISAPVFPFSDGSLEAVIAQDTEGDLKISQEAVTVDGNPGTKVISEIDLGEELRYRRVTVYVPRGSQLSKFILDFRAGDPGEARFLQMFDELLNSTILD